MTFDKANQTRSSPDETLSEPKKTKKKPKPKPKPKKVKKRRALKTMDSIINEA